MNVGINLTDQIWYEPDTATTKLVQRDSSVEWTEVFVRMLHPIHDSILDTLTLFLEGVGESW